MAAIWSPSHFCSIEYWPEPQRGIAEAYRVLKPGGIACVIGPVYPTFWLSRIMADVWMLFPREEEYIEWFKNAGFEDIKLKRVGPSWYRGVRRHGLIMGCSVTAVKTTSGDSPLKVCMWNLLKDDFRLQWAWKIFWILNRANILNICSLDLKLRTSRTRWIHLASWFASF